MLPKQVEFKGIETFMNYEKGFDSNNNNKLLIILIASVTAIPDMVIYIDEVIVRNSKK